MHERAFYLAILAITLLIDFETKSILAGNEKLLSDKQHTDYRTLINQDGLLSMLYMGSKHEWLVTVTRNPQNHELPIYRMSFHLKIKADIFEKLFEYESVDIFQTAYTRIEGDRLLSVWTTGSAHRLKIFAVIGKTVREVLSVGWKSDPEFVHLTKDNELEILVPLGELPGQWPQFAERYRWSGTEYVLIDKVFWEDRFKGLEK